MYVESGFFERVSRVTVNLINVHLVSLAFRTSFLRKSIPKFFSGKNLKKKCNLADINFYPSKLTNK